MNHSIRTRGLAMLGLAGVVALAAGCDDDATSPEGEAQVSAEIQDVPDSQEVASRAALAGFLTQDQSSYSGTLTADAQVQVSADGSTFVDLGPPRQVTIQLQSADGSTSVHSDVAVDAETYSHIRLVLEGAEATLDAGSEIGTLVLDASIALDVGSGSQVVIDKEVDVDITADSQTTLVFDLNSEAWITEENAEAEAVAASEVESATSLEIQ